MAGGIFDLGEGVKSGEQSSSDIFSLSPSVQETDQQVQEQLQLPAAPAPKQDIFSLEASAPSDQEAARAAKRESTSIMDLATGSMHRGVQSFKAIPASFEAIGAELSGDTAGAAEAAKKAKAIEDEAPEALWSLSDIRNPADFGAWLTERLGENAINILAAAATGGTGAITGSLAARGLGLSATARAALMRAGGGAGVFASTMPIETSGTVGEQFAATGSPQAGVSLAAGTIKGALELIVPMHVGYALSTPGKQLGKTVLGGMTKIGGEEAATELAQEEVDIIARKYTDPSYEYFGGPALWRRAEAGAAGAFVGMALGGPSAAIEARQEQRSPSPDESGMLPGERRSITDLRNELAPAPAPAVKEAKVRVQGVMRDVEPQATPAEALPPPPVSAEMIAPVRPEDVTFDTISDGKTQTTISIKGPDGSEVGEAYVRKLRGPPSGEPVALQVGNISIDEAWQRKGIGTALQEELEQKYGLPMVPDSTLSKEAYDRWKQIDPEAVVNYEPTKEKDAYYAPIMGSWVPGMPDTPRMARVRAALGASKYSQEVSRGIGPITTLRNMVVVPGPAELNLAQAATNGPKQDLMGVGPLLKAGLPQVTVNDMLDMLDATTPRYAVKIDAGGNYGDRLLNNTDLEFVTASGFTQAVRPQVVQINQGSLQPLGITADVFDLPPVGNSRIWFLPSVSPEESGKLETMYNDLQVRAEGGQFERLKSVETYLATKRELEADYNTLTTRGLRVVPSRGSSFYYNAVLDGKTLTPVEVVETGRSDTITFLNTETGQLTNAAQLDTYGADPGGAYLPVALDMNKFKKGEVSTLPYVVAGNTNFWWNFKEGLSPEQKERLTRKMVAIIPHDNVWTSEMIADFRSIMKQGIWLQVYPFTSQMITADPIELYQLVHGVSPIRFGQSPYGVKADSMRVLAFRLPSLTTTVEVRHPEISSVSKIADQVKAMVPVVTQLLKALGVDGGIKIEVLDFDSATPERLGTAYIAEGRIEIIAHPAVIEGGPTRIFHTLMHELGHIVTYYHYARLPMETQSQMYYAYQKALLVRRTSPLKMGESRMGPLDSPKTYAEIGVNYFASYVEWLAEQFRRWSINTSESQNFLDTQFIEIAQKMNKFYSEWEELEKSYALNMKEPDYYFSAAMEYLRNFGKEREEATQKMKQQTLYSLHQDLLDSPVTLSVTTAIQHAIQSMEGIVPQDTLIKVNPTLDETIAPPAEGAVARYMYFQNANLNLIELAVGSLKSEKAFGETRVRVAHELVHAYRRIGLLTDKQFEQLYRFAKKDNFDLRPAEKAALRNEAERFVAAQNLPQDKLARDRLYEEWLKEEIVAYYVSAYANTGFATGEAKTILDYFLEVLERIKNFIEGLGFASREQLIRAFFNGEMLERGERREEELKLVQDVANYRSELRQKDLIFDKVEQNGGAFVATAYKGVVGPKSKDVKYYWYDQSPLANSSAQPIGVLFAKNKMPKGFDIDWIESTRLLLAPRMIKYMEQDLGVIAKPSGTFTEQGYKLAVAKFPEQLRTYVRNPITGDYHSPNEIQRELRVLRATLGLMRVRGEAPAVLDKMQANIVALTKMAAKVPKGVFSNTDLLNQMFMLPRNYEKDEVQGSMVRSGSEAQDNRLQSIIGEPSRGSSVDPFSAVIDKMRKLETIKNEGIEPQTEVRYMRRILEQISHTEASPEVKKYLKQSGISQEADRIGKFTKVYWGLHQLVWRNQHISGLLDYMQDTELFNQTIARWHNRADEIARAWDQSTANRDGISSMMFWLQEMQYRSPQEVAAKIERMPTRYEVEVQAKRLKLSPEDKTLVGQIQKEFSDFISEVEQVSIDNIRDTVSDPAAASIAIMEVQAEIAKLRKKPYFPITRFGKYTITARDSLNPSHVEAFYTFDTYAQLQDSIASIHAAHLTSDLFEGRVPEEMFEFMGLPAPLIRLIRQQMPNLTPAQQAWLEDFERINFPDRSFRKRWLPARGTPGYSMDGFRVYAHYFMHGSRYLARLKYGRKMAGDIAKVRQTLDILPSSGKRRMIVDYMTKHNNYIMEGAKDWSKFKAFVSLWQLGFSPAAAAMNLTQTPMVTWPHLAGSFGNVKASAAITLAMTKLTKSKGMNPGGTGNFYDAWEEMKAQGRVDIGQAAELGAYSQGVNLGRLLGGTKLQRFYRNASYYGMWMFQKAEEINRKVTFTSAWELAMRNPNQKRLQEIRGTAATSHPGSGYNREIADLITRKGFTNQEAVAFIFAKEVIDQTQGIYAPYSRPAFMRTPLASSLLIFYQFIQMMTYVYRYNPGTVQLMLMTGALYGLGGFPGSDDLNELLKFIGKKLFGLDWDVQQHARKYARELTRGTVMDEVGPDLLLHGISRYGFGLGLLPEGWALGKFDASANGSLGKLIPGAYEALHAANTKAKPDQFVSDTMQRMSGAGFGFIFNFLQWGMENPGTTDSHKWESMLPRSARSAAKAWRLYSDEAETTRQGAKIVKFDVQDPEDLAAIGFQALGFSATKNTAKWEQLREQKDQLQLYTAERAQLYAQMDRAIRSKDAGAVKDITKAIQDYNVSVKEVDPSMQVPVARVIQSVQQRIRGRAMQEMGLPTQKGQVPVARRIQDMFPNVEAERVRTERKLQAR